LNPNSKSKAVTHKCVLSEVPATADNLMTTSPPPVKTSVGQKIKTTVQDIRESVVRGSPRARPPK